MAIVTVSELKSWINIREDVSTDDVILGELIDAVQELLELMTGKTFNVASEAIVDEQYDGWGTRLLLLNKPIDELVNITVVEDHDTDSKYDFDIDPDFAFTPGSRRLYSRVWCFPRGRNNVWVSYITAAYAPSIAKQAIKDLCAITYQRRGKEGIRSEHIGTYEYVLMRDANRESTFWARALEMLQSDNLG